MARIATVAPKSSMNKIVIIGAVLVLAGFVAIIIAAKPKQGGGNATAAAASSPASYSAGASNTAGALRARERDFDFGSISMAAGKVSHRFWFRNASSAPVLINKIYTSCMCTTATLVKGGRVINNYGMPGHGYTPSVNETVAPNEEALIEAIFDPAAHGPAGIGPTERFVTVENDAGQPLEIRFTANVKP